MLKVHLHTGTIPKFSPKFWDPCRVLQYLNGHKLKLRYIDSGEIREENGDHLKYALMLRQQQKLPRVMVFMLHLHCLL